MATIQTYSELLTQIGTYLARSDYTAQAPVWVTLAHNKIVREADNLAQETKSTSFSINAEYVNVPSDFNSVRSFRITSTADDVVLDFKPEDQMTRDHLTTGTPGYFCVVGAQFRFAPSPDATYTATLVYKAIPATMVVSSQETNSIFPAHADVYLYGALLESVAQYGDDPRIPLWKTAYDQAIASLKKYTAQRRWGGNGMTARPG